MTLELPVYLDNHATTAVDPRVVEAMLPYLTKVYGNAGSTNHAFGWKAKEAVDSSRTAIAAAVGADEREIVFTSGATESNNLAIRGIALRQRRRGNHVVSVSTEHKAVLDPLSRLSRLGYDVTLLRVEQAGTDRAGVIHLDELADALRDDTILVSVMLANNELGVIQPIEEISKICRARGVPLHCDATQGVGKIDVDVRKLGVDLMSFSAHKLYGPKGTGALFVRRGSPIVKLEAQIDGGGQEHGLRSGTLNVPGIVGFAAALQLCIAEMASEAERQATLRDRLFEGLMHHVPDVRLNGPTLALPELRLPGNLNMSFAYVDGEALMMSMRDVAVSSGAACSSVNPEPSHVLRALGLSDDLTRSSLRFGLSRYTTSEEIDFTVTKVADAVSELRKLSSGI